MTCCGKDKNEPIAGHPIPHDPDFSGPCKHRSCTDVLCLLLFLIFIGCWLGIGLYAFRNGDPSSVLVPRDSNGLRCGVDSGVENKKYLFFFDLTKCIGASVPFLGCPTPQICIESCPTEPYFPKTSYANNGKLICKDSAKERKPDGENCASWYLPSTSIERRCIPILSKKNIELLKNAMGNVAEEIKTAVDNVKLITETEQLGENVVSDLMTSWQKILIGLAGALVITLLYILLLRWTAGVMVWVSILGVIIALVLGIYASFVNYKKILNQKKITYSDEAESFQSIRKYFWLTLLIFCSLMLAIILLITICLRKRINLAVALIEEGSKAISSVTSVLVFPIFPWILQILVIVFAIAIGLLLTTTGTPVFRVRWINASDPNPSCPSSQLDSVCDPKTFNPALNCPNLVCKMIRLDHNPYYKYMHGVNIFGFFWGSFFVSALGQMILASVFATWYWTKPRHKLPFFAVTSSTCTVVRYHLGTLAFGSLIISVCRMIRLALEYIQRKLKKYDNEVTRAIMCLLKCFFWCLEKFLKFINTNAYIVCAIHGKNFCSSAREAFMLLMRNILRVFVLDKVTDFLFFISSLLISIGVGVLAYFFFVSDWIDIDESDLHYMEVPVIVIVICTYLISRIFFSVYGMAVDTLFMCFLEDCERNDGSPEKPYYMSKELMKIFGKKNKVE